MPVPAELEGKKLVGSTWVRRLGKHRGFRWIMTGFNDAGVKLEPEKQSLKGWRTHIGDHKVQSLQWPMFMNLYQPEGKLDMIVTIDKEGFVQSVQKENSNGVAVVKPEDTVKMRLCLGPWHRKDGHGTMLPEAMFDIVQIGRYHGQLSKTCLECRQKKADYEKDRVTRLNAGRVKAAPAKTVVRVETGYKPEQFVDTSETAKPGEVVFDLAPVSQPAERAKRRWKVTYIPDPVEVTIEVEADNFFDAGMQVKGDIKGVHEIV